MSPTEVTEIHLDNSRIHLYSIDYNPRCSKKKNVELAERAKALYTPGMGMGKRRFEASVDNATKPELVALIQSMEGKRTPGISRSPRRTATF